LESRERTNHDDTWAQALPASRPAQVLENLTGADAWRLVQDGHNAIGWVRDDGAEDTGDVTGGKGDHQLLALGALGSWLGYDVLVDGFDSLLKATELHHGVWDLTEPEWLETLEEWIAALSLHFTVSFTHVVSVAWHGLNSYLHSLEWREEDIGKELGGRRGGQVKVESVGVSALLAHSITIEYLEDFVEAELAYTLEAVAQQSRGPSLGQTAGAIFGHSNLEAGTEVLVLGGVHLKSALDEIEWHDGRMRQTTRQHTAEGAKSVEFWGAWFAGVLRIAGDDLRRISHVLPIPADSPSVSST